MHAKSSSFSHPTPHVPRHFVVSPVLRDSPHKLPRDLRVECVLARVHPPVVVRVALPPVLLLAVEDDVTDDAARLPSSPGPTRVAEVGVCVGGCG